LAAMAGGDRALQTKMVERFKDTRATMTPDAVRTAWADAKMDIYTARLSEAAGDYRVVILVRGAKPEDGAGLAFDPVLGMDPRAFGPTGAVDPADQADAAPPQREVLGVIGLQASGSQVEFRGGVPELSVPEDFLAIRIAAPGQLKEFPIESLQELPLDAVTSPLDLLPQDDGGWRGEVLLSDGRVFEMVMEPMASQGDVKKQEEGEESTKSEESEEEKEE